MFLFLLSSEIGDAPNDDFGGVGSIAFPSMSRNEVTNRLWCRGCERTFEFYRLQKLDRDVLSWLVPPGWNAFTILMGLQ
jgi:hypothetical protein